MNKQLVLTAAILAPWTCSQVSAAAAKRPPNIVFMVADDLGIGDVGCYGSAKIKTPAIDALCREGVRCTDAHAPAAVCTPSRYGILTGRYFWRIKKEWQGELLIEPARPTIATVLHNVGYATGYFGKWHLGWGEADPSHPRTHRADWDWNAPELKPGVMEAGFDRYYGTPFSANEPPSIFIDQRTTVGRDPSDPLTIAGPKQEKGWGYGVSHGAKAAHTARPVDQIDFITTEKSIEFIRLNKNRPFFLHLAFVAPHVPLAPSKAFQGRTTVGAYGDYVEQLDSCVGRVAQALKEAGLEENTLVIFTSDNGAILHRSVYRTHRSNLEWLGQKCDAWEGGVRIPLMARWPGRIDPGSENPRLFSLTDIFATVCAAAGASLPADGAPDSVNQLPVLENPASSAVRTEMAYQGIFGLALRSGNWVFIPKHGSQGVTTEPKMNWAMQFEELGMQNSDFDTQGRLLPNAPPGQLYNLAEDPKQARNLYNQHPEIVGKLAAQLKHLTENSNLANP